MKGHSEKDGLLFLVRVQIEKFRKKGDFEKKNLLFVTKQPHSGPWYKKRLWILLFYYRSRSRKAFFGN